MTSVHEPALTFIWQFTGTSAIVSTTSTPILAIKRALVGESQIVSATSQPAMLRKVALIGTSAVVSSASAPTLAIKRVLAAISHLVSTTSAPSLLPLFTYLESQSYPSGSPQPTYFTLQIDGGTPFNVAVTVNVDGSVMLKYSLSSLSVGTHTANYETASDVWGTSGESVSITFNVAVAA